MGVRFWVLSSKYFETKLFSSLLRRVCKNDQTAGIFPPYYNFIVINHRLFQLINVNTTLRELCKVLHNFA